MNDVSLVGRLTRDPELRDAGESDRKVCALRIAVDGGKHDPLYIDVETFDRQAEACAHHLAKGRQIGVSGRLRYREWTAGDGTRRSKHSVIGRVEFLGSRPDSAPNSAEPAEDEEIPF